MKILTIDSAMNGCSAGVYDTETLTLTERSIQVARGQAEVLMPLINDVMDLAGINYKMLDVIAVTRGPGAFTGMRIGLATAKAIGLAASIPVCGITTFDAVFKTYLLENENVNAQAIAIVLETKRKDYYFQIFDGKSFLPLSNPAALSEKEVCDCIVEYDNMNIVGDAGARLKEGAEALLGATHISYETIQQPCALGIAKVAEEKCKGASVVYEGAPCYLRKADVTMPKKQGKILQ